MSFIYKEIITFKNSFLKYLVNKASTNRSNISGLCQERILFLKRELKNKDKIMQSFLTQIPVKTELQEVLMVCNLKNIC